MARSLPFARRLLPRFGIAWAFVAMLFLISGAGWWKFHRDLYIEEVEVIRALKASAGKVRVRRSAGLQYPPPAEEDFDGPTPWNAPLLPPVYSISVDGEVSDEVRDSAARLPRLAAFTVRLDGRIVRVPPPQPFDFAAHLGRELPELPDATLPVESVASPLPEGEEVDAEEAARVAAAIYAAWRDEAAIPASVLVVSRNTELKGPIPADFGAILVEPDRRYHYYGKDFYIRAVHLVDDVRYDFGRHGDEWSLETRDFESDLRRHDEVFRRFTDDVYPYLGADFHGFLTVSRAIEAMPRYEFDRIAKVDDVRYRVDFKPFAAPMNDEEKQFHVVDPRVTEWSLVLRSDLDWAPEESKIIQSLQQTSWPAPTSHERRLSQRFRREGEHVLLTERVVQESRSLAGAMTVTELSKHAYAYDLDPEYDERIFDPTSLDPQPWPARRELPWLRWYRVTFLLGCTLAVCIVSSRFRARRSTTHLANTEPDEAIE